MYNMQRWFFKILLLGERGVGKTCIRYWNVERTKMKLLKWKLLILIGMIDLHFCRMIALRHPTGSLWLTQLLIRNLFWAKLQTWNPFMHCQETFTLVAAMHLENLDWETKEEEPRQLKYTLPHKSRICCNFSLFLDFEGNVWGAGKLDFGQLGRFLRPE